MIGECDLDGAIAEQFSVTVAEDFIHFFKSGPCEVDQVLAEAEIEAGLQRPEGDFAVAVAPIVIVAGSTRSRSPRSQGSASKIRQRPTKRQFEAELMATPPSVSATVPGHPRPHDQPTRSAYIFGAIWPEHGKAAALVMPWCDTHAMKSILSKSPERSPRMGTPFSSWTRQDGTSPTTFRSQET